MRLIAFMYHDVVEGAAWDESGFSEPDAARYKLDRSLFAEHLDAIAGATGRTAVLVDQLPHDDRELPFLLTFDDGGASAHSCVAEMLETRGWRGHFFVTTDRIGTTGFLTESQIRDLRNRGHLIGSHSCSHPAIMSAVPRGDLVAEWTQSVGVLSSILGEPVHIASVPGGYFSRRVARAATEAGIRTLFNSEPVTRLLHVGECVVIGRFGAFRGMPAKTVAALAAGKPMPRLTQYLSWNAKKLLKEIGGRRYVQIRRAILKHRRPA